MQTEQQQIKQVAKNTAKFEAAWGRYIDRLAKFDEVQPDGRANYARRKAVRAARRNLQRVCQQIGTECPV